MDVQVDSGWRAIYLLSLAQQVDELVSVLSRFATPALAGHVGHAAEGLRRAITTQCLLDTEPLCRLCPC
jgi:hypothetical protein